MQCFNEPDASSFFLRELSTFDQPRERCAEYCKLYDAFVRGALRASEDLCLGGPVVAGVIDFFEAFLEHVRENNLRLDFISLHNYGTKPSILEREGRRITVNAAIEKQEKYLKAIRAQGFEDVEILMDEWGITTSGFKDTAEFPVLIFRETEVFPAYYVKMIAEFIRRDYNVSKLFICLSGQHEMTAEFTGFRNFFGLNFIKKPIYNAHVMASRLRDGLLSYECENGNVSVVPTRDDEGNYSVLMSYSSEFFDEDADTVREKLCFEEDLRGSKIKVYRIDKSTTNPYRLYQREGMGELSGEDIKRLRKEGELSPIFEGTLNGEEEIVFTPNSTYFVSVER